MDQAIVNAARVYERVKFRNTGEARIVLGKKKPENGTNYKYLKEFVEKANTYNLIPNFYFETFYADGNKVIPTKPECKKLADDLNLHYYEIWLKQNTGALKDFLNGLHKTEENIKIFLQDNHIFGKPDSDYTPSDFLSINPLNRVLPDWILMLNAGLIHPLFLFTRTELMPFYKYLLGGRLKNFEHFIHLYKRYNENGKLAQFLDKKFGKYVDNK